MEYKSILEALKRGVAVVLGIATIMGGIWVWGPHAALLAVLIGLGVVGIALWINTTSRAVPNQMGVNGFRYPRPDWLTSGSVLQFNEMAKGALVLLAFDRAASGCWGKTYLYRRHISKSGIPLAGGSLTGTPLALTAVASCVLDENGTAVRDWLRHPLLETLARILTQGGHYLHGFSEGQVGTVPAFEPLRHSAGGCLSKLLLSANGPGDLRTLQLLCNPQELPMSWDKAVTARTLLHMSFLRRIPLKIRYQGKRRSRVLIEALLAVPAGLTGAHIWSDSYGYGKDANNQWASVWALLPIVAAKCQPRPVNERLREVLRRFLLAQAAAAPSDTGLLPNKIDKTGKGSGQHVLGTAMALAAWRTLEVSKTDDNIRDADEAAVYGQKMLNRLLESWPGVLELPAFCDEHEPLELEGYFAWAALLIAAATLGVFVTTDDYQKVVRLVAEVARLDPAAVQEGSLGTIYTSQLIASGLFMPETIPVVGAALHRIARLQPPAS